MAIKKVREFLRKNGYEAYAFAKEPGYVCTFFPEKKQNPEQHEQKIDFIIKEDGLAFVIDECNNITDGFVKVSPFAIRSVICSKIIANCKAWRYNSLLFTFFNSEREEVEEEAFYNLMLPWELSEEDSEKDDGFNFLLSQAMANNFDVIFDRLAEQNGYLDDYKIVKQLITKKG
jgi:hypothetical protein